MGIHAMRTVYVGKTSRILGRLDLIGTAISPQRCFALVSRRGMCVCVCIRACGCAQVHVHSSLIHVT
jgi:hypothetical protein